MELFKRRPPEKKIDLDDVPVLITFSTKIPASKYSFEDIFKSQRFKNFLNYVGCDEKTARKIISKYKAQIFSNCEKVLVQNKLPANGDAQFNVPLTAFMAAIAASYCRLESFLNINQNDIIAIASMESTLNPTSVNSLDVGLMQINGKTIRDLDLFASLKTTKQNMEKAGAKPFTLSDIGVTEKNYATELKKPEKAMAAFVLVIYRKLSMALADFRAVGKNNKYVNSTKANINRKKHNLWWKIGDPREIYKMDKTAYRMNPYQKRYFFSDYYNGNGELDLLEISYDAKYANHVSLLDYIAPPNVTYDKKKYEKQTSQQRADKNKQLTYKKDNPPKKFSYPTEQKLKDFMNLLDNNFGQISSSMELFSYHMYGENSTASNFWADQFTNRQAPKTKRQDTKLFSVMDVLNPSVKEMVVIVQTLWDISVNKSDYAFDKKDNRWQLYDAMFSFDADEHIGTGGKKRAYARWFVRSLQTALNGGTKIAGPRGKLFKLVLKAAKNNFKRLPDGGKDLMRRIKNINKALTDSKDKLS